MSGSSILWSPAPYHIISYGTLLGASFYQSFINGIVSYRALPRPHFSILQEKLTPVYFSLQTALSILLALTYPAASTHLQQQHLSAGAAVVVTGSSGLLGMLEPRNRWTVALPIGLMLCCNTANLLVIGPTTTAVMHERKRQEVRDGKKSFEAAGRSGEMERLNRRFGVWHGVSAMVNLVGLGVGVWYGVLLAGRLV